MPIYEYRCINGHEFEVTQRMADDPVETCEQCGAPVERVFHPVAVHFKGSGFYTTDYASKAKVGAGKEGDSGGGSNDSSPGKGDSAKGKSKSGGESKSGGGDKAKAGSGKDQGA
jgi:putative FmdB family regulatory protein